MKNPFFPSTVIILMSFLLANCQNPVFKAVEDNGAFAYLKSITITKPLKNTLYTRGEALDISGLEVTGTYSDGSTKLESVTLSHISGYNPYQDEKQDLTVTINNKSAKDSDIPKYPLQVYVAVFVGIGSLQEIKAGMPIITTVSPEGDWTVKLDRNSPEPLLGTYFIPADTNPGPHQIEVSLNASYSRTYDITVAP
ncbi:MAG: bacterial Ig-like domain-containing protein [Treponema sp.]|nr:bacterial Ig-like domain-containing protein [Treponema sp.]